MENRIFGEMNYHTGWEKKMIIPFNNQKIEIVIHAKAHGVEEEITQEQENLFSYFHDNVDFVMKEVEQELLKDSGKEYAKRYTPVMLLIKKDGRSALLFDDIDDLENGLAISFFSGIRIMTQDEFL